MYCEDRISVILEKPNPLFESWLTGWLKEATEKNSKAKYPLREALESLKRYPLPLESGQHCAILRGFGTTLCRLIDEKLKEYKNCHLEEYNKSINYWESVKEVAKNYTYKPKIKTRHQKARLNLEDEDEQVILSAENFDIILLVDTQETSGKSKVIIDETQTYLKASNVAYEIRRLGVGDFCWICRDRLSKQELILPYIIERKRMDDFASSIRDGRFHEQKHRLQASGIENIIYLIESYGKNQHIGLPMPTLQQAATNTQIHSKFQIKFTDNHKDSILYISVLGKIITETFKKKNLIGTPKDSILPINLNNSFVGLMKFKEFQSQSTKSRTFTVRDIFLKQLLQLKSLSINKAMAITSVYPTPKTLFQAYKDCNSTDEAEKLLANIPCDSLMRTIGLPISKTIYQFYNC